MKGRFWLRNDIHKLWFNQSNQIALILPDSKIIIKYSNSNYVPKLMQDIPFLYFLKVWCQQDKSLTGLQTRRALKLSGSHYLHSGGFTVFISTGDLLYQRWSSKLKPNQINQEFLALFQFQNVNFNPLHKKIIFWKKQLIYRLCWT